MLWPKIRKAYEDDNTLVLPSFGYSVNTLQVRILGSADSVKCQHLNLNEIGVRSEKC